LGVIEFETLAQERQHGTDRLPVGVIEETNTPQQEDNPPFVGSQRGGAGLNAN
jgi:hypothetical protein